MTISSNDEEPETIYDYSYSSERFERLNMDTYKISIHKSFREQGQVKKKQWVICTMDYYDLVDGTWAGDCVVSSSLKIKLQEMQMDESTLWDLVYDKLQPLIDKALVEYHATEEYKTYKRNSEIVRTYEETKNLLSNTNMKSLPLPQWLGIRIKTIFQSNSNKLSKSNLQNLEKKIISQKILQYKSNLSRRDFGAVDRFV
jgi:hypothetical protein